MRGVSFFYRLGVPRYVVMMEKAQQRSRWRIFTTPLAFCVDEDERLPLGKSPGGFFPCTGYYPLHGSAGDTHSLSSLFLGQSFKITKPQRLEFITMQIYLYELWKRCTGGLESPPAKEPFTMSDFFRSWRHIERGLSV
jgi:hypothetical protein